MKQFSYFFLYFAKVAANWQLVILLFQKSRGENKSQICNFSRYFSRKGNKFSRNCYCIGCNFEPWTCTQTLVCLAYICVGFSWTFWSRGKTCWLCSKSVFLLFVFITVAFKDLWGDFWQWYYFLVLHFVCACFSHIVIDIKIIILTCWLTPVIVSVWHSMSVEACTALVHMYCTVVKHGCHVSSMPEKNSHIYPISWCQKWHVFGKTSKKCEIFN